MAKAKAVRDWLVEHKKKCEYEGCKRQAQFEIYGEFYCYKHGGVLMDNLLTSKVNGFSLFLADKYRS